MKFLFIHPFGIGDVIFSLAAAEALVRRGHTIDYLCNERTHELLALCPVVRRTHIFDRSALREDWKARRFVQVFRRYSTLRRHMAAEEYDAALDFSMGREYALLAWLAGIDVRIGWDYKRRGRWLTRRRAIKNFDDRSPRDYAMDLARIADPRVGSRPAYPAVDLRKAAPDAGAAQEDERWLLERAGAGPWIVMAPGGGESWGRDAHYKRWPESSWIRLARLLARDTRARLVILGSASEAPLVASVAAEAASASAGPAAAVSGEPFRRVLALLSGARAFIGTDGGLLHLANLVGTPAVGIYGPVSEIGYAPLDSAAPFQTLTAPVPCRPCYKNFRFTGCAYDKRCLTDITPDAAADAIKAFLTSES